VLRAGRLSGDTRHHGPSRCPCRGRRGGADGVGTRGRAFGVNIDTDVEMLKMDGSIGAYATNDATPKIPIWLMVFKDIRDF
jgi:hypothetical protein